MKTWLANNKIYLDILSTVLIGATSFYVGIVANQVSKSQLEIARLGVLPHISVSEKFYINEAGFATDTRIEVANYGAPVRTSNITAHTFYVISSGQHAVWIPINGYYDASFKKAAVTGLLTELQGVGNNSSYHDVYMQHLNMSKDDPLNLTELERVTIVRVEYETRTKEKYEDYFLSSSWTDQPWVEAMFNSYSDHWPLERRSLQWADLEEAYFQISNGKPSLVRENISW